MNVNENNIRPYLLDIPEGDHDIRITVEKPEESIAARHHDLADTAAAGIELQIADPAQFTAISYVDDIFIFQFGVQHLKTHKPFLLTSMQLQSRREQKVCLREYFSSSGTYYHYNSTRITGAGKRKKMTQGKVEICGVNTSKLPLLKAEEKEALFQQIEAGDSKAREAYIEGNLRLVLSVIKRFSSSNENVDDLFQIGCIGLIKAIDNFDSSLNVKFSTYAVPMIIGEIRRFLRDNSQLRVSRSLKDTAYKAIYAREALTRKNLKEPSIEEIATEIGVSKEDIAYALDAIQNPMSLYEPIFTDGGDTLYVMDQISDKKNKEETWVEHLSLSEAMKRLNPREHQIISLRFFEGKTQMEVAESIGISQAQVSRLEKNALRTMKNYLTA